MATARWVPVDGGRLRVEVAGSGRPVVVVQTALDDDELRPLCTALTARGGLEVFHVLRRGYADGGPPLPHPSIATDAADVAAVVRALDLGPVHVVGASYSAAVVLTVAALHPEVVRSLTVVEAPPSGTPTAPEFRTACERLQRTHVSQGAVTALDEFMTMLIGPDWREASERDRPGSVAAMERGATAFFDADLASLIAWTIEAPDPNRVPCPVLLIGGGETSRWFSQMHDRLLDLLPHATSASVESAGHLVASTHPGEVAGLVSAAN